VSCSNPTRGWWGNLKSTGFFTQYIQGNFRQARSWELLPPASKGSSGCTLAPGLQNMEPLPSVAWRSAPQQGSARDLVHVPTAGVKDNVSLTVKAAQKAADGPVCNGHASVLYSGFAERYGDDGVDGLWGCTCRTGPRSGSAQKATTYQFKVWVLLPTSTSGIPRQPDRRLYFHWPPRGHRVQACEKDGFDAAPQCKLRIWMSSLANGNTREGTLHDCWSKKSLLPPISLTLFLSNPLPPISMVSFNSFIAMGDTVTLQRYLEHANMLGKCRASLRAFRTRSGLPGVISQEAEDHDTPIQSPRRCCYYHDNSATKGIVNQSQLTHRPLVDSPKSPFLQSEKPFSLGNRGSQKPRFSETAVLKNRESRNLSVLLPSMAVTVGQLIDTFYSQPAFSEPAFSTGPKLSTTS
jgi:hypothetical protein